MNKIYRQATPYCPAIDSRYVSEEYLSHAREISDMISKLDLLRNKIEGLHEITGDNGDVAFELKESIEKLGIALATCMGYQGEYQMEACGKDLGDLENNEENEQ